MARGAAFWVSWKPVWLSLIVATVGQTIGGHADRNGIDKGAARVGRPKLALASLFGSAAEQGQENGPDGLPYRVVAASAWALTCTDRRRGRINRKAARKTP